MIIDLERVDISGRKKWKNKKFLLTDEKNVFLDFLWFMCVKLSEIDSVLAENDFTINYVVASQ